MSPLTKLLPRLAPPLSATTTVPLLNGHIRGSERLSELPWTEIRPVIGRSVFASSVKPISVDYVWGVIDMVPDTDFADIRHKATIHSTNGSLMIIPRESDKVRLYVNCQGKTSWTRESEGLAKVNRARTKFSKWGWGHP
ncbi:hypothetical protein EDD16DRAFT_170170 [Pisolithus croceorrhizus]|nr:hypothetical protein EDD16DRAFT_170170 [Pisolithus croceorrhizus]